MKKLGLIFLIGVVSIAINWLALLAGWWWLTPATGLLIGLILRSTGLSLLTSLCTGGLSWGLPLAVLAINAPVKSVASAVESVVGFSATGGIAILVLTIVLGCVLSLTGTWVGLTSRRLVRPAWQQYTNSLFTW